MNPSENTTLPYWVSSSYAKAYSIYSLLFSFKTEIIINFGQIDRFLRREVFFRVIRVIRVVRVVRVIRAVRQTRTFL